MWERCGSLSLLCVWYSVPDGARYESFYLAVDVFVYGKFLRRIPFWTILVSGVRISLIFAVL
jgi:hypothetical protein